MDRVTQQPDGSYHWSCSVEKEFHQKSVKSGLWGCVILVVFILTVYFVIHGTADFKESIWIALLPIGVVLVIALPLLLLSGKYIC